MSEQSKPRRGLKIALALSLAVNLAIVGLVLGAMIGFGPMGDRDDPRLRALGLGPFAMALSREERAGVGARIDRATMRAERRALGEGLVSLRQALRAEPFDRAAAAAALARMRDATVTLQTVSHDALLDQIAQMPAADRAALADRFARALRRMGGHRSPG
jgi:hypothetical protein